jgi:hypothetical protein
MDAIPASQWFPMDALDRHAFRFLSYLLFLFSFSMDARYNRRASSIEHPASSIQHRASSIEHPASSIAPKNKK